MSDKRLDTQTRPQCAVNSTAYQNEEVMVFVGVEFSQENYKIGESELNFYLKDGFHVVKDFQTSSGVVFCLSNSRD